MRISPDRIPLFLLFILIPGYSFAQQLLFTNYTQRDGLVSNVVRRIFHDSKGFLWIATWEGLSKYDGNRFTNYSTGNGLSHDLINDFSETADGSLMIAANDGSIDLIKENQVISRVMALPSAINRLLSSPNHPLIASSDKEGINEIRNGKLFTPKQDFPRTSYSNIIWLNDSLLIAISDSMIRVFDSHYELFAELKLGDSYFTECDVFMDSQKRIWLASYLGLVQIILPASRNLPLTLITPLPPFNIPELKQNKINHIFEDDKSNIWFGTIAGLVKINRDSSYQVFTTKEGLPSNNITQISQDRENNIWLGSTSGISKLVTKTSIRIYNTEAGLLANTLFFVQPVNNENLIVSTTKGVQLFNKKSGHFSILYNESREIFNRAIISGNDTYLFDNDNIVFINPDSHKIIKESSFHFKDPKYYTGILDQSKNIFLSDGEHLYYLPGENGKPVIILQDSRISTLLIDKYSNLWVGTWEKGLYCIHYKVNEKTISIITKDHCLPDENLRSLFEDSGGNIWAGTRYRGVYVLNKNKSIFISSHFDQSKGLTSNWITNIEEDRSGNIWLALYQGLDKLIKHDSSYRVFNFSRVNNYFASIASIAIDKGNSIWLATTDGMAEIRDGEMENLAALPVYITRIFTSDSVYSVNAPKLKLKYPRNQLQFEFSSPGFINEKQVFYSYRLVGSSNEEWTSAENNHSVSYANFRPGSYRFEVRTLGWNGKWGTAASYEFEVLPPFWQTGWFLTASLLLIGGLIFWIVRSRIRNIRQAAELKQKVAETEMAALRAQMNPHFIFNCINSIDALIQSNDKYNATVYLNKFAKLIRNILDSSKQNLIPLSKDLETLQLYIDLEQFRNENKFTAEIKTDEILLLDDFRIPPLIIQPYVENAILHGLRNRTDDKGWLLVSVSNQNGQIEYIIEDNGVGRVATINSLNGEKTSYGMEMSNERVKLFNKEEHASVKITDLDKEGKPAGTRVTVLLKLQ